MSPPRVDYSTHRCKHCGARDWSFNNNGTVNCRPCRNAHSRAKRRERRLLDPNFVEHERAAQRRYRESMKAQRQRIKALEDGNAEVSPQEAP